MTGGLSTSADALRCLPRIEDMDILAPILPLLPPRNTGRFGRSGDPLNLVFLATETNLRRALVHSGWVEIPRSICASAWRGLHGLLSGKRSPQFPPMNRYRLSGRIQDFNWAQPVTSFSKRHHFRLWRTAWQDQDGRTLWWGSANYDVRLRWWDLSHVPDPDLDLETAFIKSSLQGCPHVRSMRWQSLPHAPRAGINDKGYAFRSSGRALIVALD